MSDVYLSCLGTCESSRDWIGSWNTKYIVDSVKDNESNKAILHSVTTIKKLRQNFTQYETQQK